MYQFKFADIGEGIHEGQLLKWMVKEGDEIKDGETLCVVETDKVNAELPSPVDGKIDKIYFQEGDTIHVGEVLVNIDDGSETAQIEDKNDKKEKKEPVVEGDEEEASGVVGEIEVSSEVIDSSDEHTERVETNKDKKVLATPVARKLAKDLGVDITTIKGSGPVGRVMKEDIYKAKEQNKPKEEIKLEKLPQIDHGENVERKSISKLRKTIARNMAVSNQLIPHAVSMHEYDMSKLVKFRKEQKEMAQKEGIHLTYMPFIIKAVAIALKEFPVFNSSFDHENDEILLKKDFNIGIAVDTEDGLIVPVIKHADQLSILEIAKQLEALSKAARKRTIALDALQGGTFTITNYGAFGLSYGVPVIKYPEVAIIGMGRIQKKPVVVDDEIVIRDLMPVSLSFDHRVIDGGDAGRFLVRLEQLLSDPMLLLLS